MNLFIIRHGQTTWNKENLFQGQSNIPLNSNGISQAENLATSLKDKKIDIIYSSPLDRAVQTANILNQYHNAPHIIDPLITERYLGELEGKCAFDYDLPTIWKHILNLDAKSDSIYGIETLELLLKRGKEFLNKIILQYGNTSNNIYIVAHGSMNLALLLLLGQIDTSKPLQEVRIENCYCYTVKNPSIEYS